MAVQPTSADVGDAAAESRTTTATLLWSDNIHPQPTGGRLYEKVVRAVVLSALHKRPRLHRPRRRHAPPPTGFLLRASYATLYS